MDEQELIELNRLQQHFLNKYGIDGLYDSDLQDRLADLGRQGPDQFLASRLAMGLLLFNSHIASDGAYQNVIDAFLGDRKDTAAGMIELGNTPEARMHFVNMKVFLMIQ